MKIALAACSDPVSPDSMNDIYKVIEKLRASGVDAELIPAFFEPDHSPEKRGRALNACFRDPQVDYIFDVSGGDLANQVLPYLDFDAIRESHTVFVGYSDLTTVINAIIARTGRLAVNYQIRHILSEHGDEQMDYLLNTILADRISPRDLECRFIRGSRMSGRVLGGNIRCFLKLAGTPYWPDPDHAILLLESLRGRSYQMLTQLAQYGQMGVWDKISGILLGTFTKMEESMKEPPMAELVLQNIPPELPVAETRFIGHYTDARAIVLGRETVIEA